MTNINEDFEEISEFHHEPTEDRGEESGEDLTQLQTEVLARPATIQERFSAFFLDTLIFSYLALAWAIFLNYITYKQWSFSFHYSKSMLFFFGSTTLALHLVYYFLFEGIFSATPGKMLAGLSVQRSRRGTPSLISIFLRNILRIIDYPLCLITSVALMEATDKHQRFGDFVARTMVARELNYAGRRIQPESAKYAGITRRGLAFLCDLLLLVPFYYGLMLLIPINQVLLSLILLNSLPLLTVLYLTLIESCFDTTLGKAIFGLRVVSEDGRPASFATLLLRNFFKPFDLNPVGYMCSALSSHKQRPGDIIAGTCVVRDRQAKRMWFAIPTMLLFSLGLAYLGWVNPNSFYKNGMKVQISFQKHIYSFYPIPPSLQRLSLKGFRVETIELGFNEEEINEKATYRAGDTVYIITQISGYTIKSDSTWIEADLEVTDANNQLILTKPRIINSSLPTLSKKSLRLATRFVLNPQATPGKYQITLILRDTFGQQTLTKRKVFIVQE